MRIYSAWIPALIGGHDRVRRARNEDVRRHERPGGTRHVHRQPVPAAAAAAIAAHPSRLVEPLLRVGVLSLRRGGRSGCSAASLAVLGDGAWIALSALFVCLYPRSLFFSDGRHRVQLAGLVPSAPALAEGADGQPAALSRRLAPDGRRQIELGGYFIHMDRQRAMACRRGRLSRLAPSVREHHARCQPAIRVPHQPGVPVPRGPSATASICGTR